MKREQNETTFVVLNAMITNLNLSLNVANKITAFQSFELINIIFNDYAYLTIEMIALCFKNGKKGVYGGTFNRLDVEVVSTWLYKFSTSDEYQQMIINYNKPKVEDERKPMPKELEAIRDEVLKELTENINKRRFGSSPVRPLTEETFIENLKVKIPKWSNEQLSLFLEEYTKENFTKGIELINEEINKRNSPPN